MLDLDQIDQADAILIQRGLRELGFYQGTTRGLPGPKTKDAYARYLGTQWEGDGEVSAIPGLRPAWLVEAEKWIGLREIPGPRHAVQVLRWWTAIRAPFTDDETPWCAGFVGGVLETVGIRSTRSAAARSYESFGRTESIHNIPPLGSIAVFWRGSRSGWSGHVAFVVGVTPSGDPLCLGGNQSNAVTVARFDRDRLLSYRWPSGQPIAPPAPVLSSAAAYSHNEA